MLIGYKRGQGSIVLRIKILNSSASTGAGLTGLSSTSSGLIISTIADNEATATSYTVAASNVETITTLGTYAAPTAGKCRFREVDSTNHKGVYEIQLADARFGVSNAKSLLVSVLGATNAAETDVVIPLRDLDPFDAVRAGLTALPNVASGSAGSLLTSGTGTSQLNVSGGTAAADMVEIAGQTVTAAAAVTFPAIISSLTAAGVWDEPYNQHTTAGSFGKLMDTLRKANYVTEGVVAAGGTPTTTVFRTNLTEPNGTFDSQTLLFVSGSLTGQSAPIETYSVANGTITLGEPLTAAPTAGDAFVILPDHVHALGEIADAVLDDAVEGSETLRQAVRLIRAAAVGKLSGAATTEITIRDAADTKARITATVDSNGNRSAVTTDAT
jgi:hypothetical protein